MLGWLKRAVGLGGARVPVDRASALYARGCERGFVEGYERGFAVSGLGAVPVDRAEAAASEGERLGRVSAGQVFRGSARFSVPARAVSELCACGYASGYEVGLGRGCADASPGRHVPRAVLRTILKGDVHLVRARAASIAREVGA